MGDYIKDIMTDEQHKFLYKQRRSDAQKVGLYFILNKIIKFGEDAIRKAAEAGAYAVIDEYGLLEKRGGGFHNITKQVLGYEDYNKCIILMKNINLEFFLQRFEDYNFKVFELNSENRDNLHEEIFAYIKHS